MKKGPTPLPNGCLLLVCLLPVFAFINLIHGDRITGWFQRATWLHVLVGLLLCAIMAKLAWKAGHDGNERTKIACLAAIFASSVVVFAIGYAAVFWFNPTSFRVSEDLLRERQREDIKKIGNRVATLAREQVDFLEMYSNPSVLMAAVASERPHPGLRGAKLGEAVLPDGNRIKTLLTSSPAYLDGDFYDVANRIFWIADSSGLPSDYRKAEFKLAEDVGVKLGNAKTPQEVQRLVQNKLNRVHAELDRTKLEMYRIARGGTQLDLSHFIYFSMAVMTTVGSNDISPNGELTRGMVVAQAGFAVFLLGFALQILWTRKNGTSED